MEEPGTKKKEDCNLSPNSDGCNSQYKDDSSDTSDTVKDTDHCNPESDIT